MKKWIPLFLLFLTPALAKAPNKVLKIAIVDTGLNLNDSRFKDHLCPTGHKDFTGTGMEDKVGHGTFVTGLIQKYAKDGDFCFLIYKYTHFDSTFSGYVNLQNEVKAFREAVKNGARIINFSAGGPEFDEDEYLFINGHPKVTFVVAAGNEGKNIDTKDYFYPASYHAENVVVVGNITEDGNPTPHSNWTDYKMYWEVGNAVSTLPNGHTGSMDGTSFSAAIRTGKLIREKLDAAK